jgi:hypothetical protein
MMADEGAVPKLSKMNVFLRLTYPGVQVQLSLTHLGSHGALRHAGLVL